MSDQKQRLVEWYKDRGDHYFMVNNPRDEHSTLFYMRYENEGKRLTFVFGRGANGRGAVLNFSWFW